jgi:hypothetical protein
LNSDIGRFAQSPVGQGLIAEAQGKRFKDGFLAALPGAVINSTPLILKTLKYAPPTVLYGTSPERAIGVLDAVTEGAEFVLETAGHSQVAQNLGAMGVGYDLVQGGMAASKGNWGSVADSCVDIGLFVVGTVAEVPTLYPKLIYMTVKAEVEGLSNANVALGNMEYYIDKNLTADMVIQSSRPVTQRQTLYSTQYVRRQQYQDRIMGRDAELQYESTLSDLEKIRHRDPYAKLVR